jgi:phenylalanyl-tRNA synthetase beta chain
LTAQQVRTRKARRALAARGLVEAVTWSFIARDTARVFGGGQDALELANPISTEMSSMRPTLLAGLLAGVQKNRNRGFADLGLFEVGQAYRGDAPDDQFVAASGVRAGAAPFTGPGRHWSRKTEEASLFDAKADVVALLAELGFDAAKAQLTRDAPAWFHPGRSATLRLGPKIVLAHFGEIHPETLRVLDVANPVAAFEVFLGALPPQRKKSLARDALEAPDLLPVRRDFAFLLDHDVAAGDVIRAALGSDKKLIVAASVFDLFEGESLGAGKKSLALEVTLQPREKTLTDQEIEAVAARIVAAVGKVTGGAIRK